MGQLLIASYLLSILAAQVLLQTTVVIGSGLILCILFRKRPENQNTICRLIVIALLVAPFALLLINNEDNSPLTVTLPLDKTPLTAKSQLIQETSAVQSFQYSSGIGELDIVKAPSRVLHGFAAPTLSTDNVSPVNEVYESGVAEVTVSSTRINPSMKYLQIVYFGISLGWIVLVLLGVGRMICSFRNLRYIIRTGIPVEPDIQQLVDNQASRIHVVSPAVLASPFTHSPFLAGLSRPVIIVPEYLTLSNDIIVHELMHLKRHDLAWSLGGRLLAILLPIQPLMHLLTNLMEETNDLVCDHLVVDQVGNARHYAHRLISLAALLNPESKRDSFGVGLLPSRKSLRFRISRILSHDLHPFSPMRKYALMISGAMVFMVSAMSGYIEVHGGELQGERIREIMFRSPLTFIPRMKQTFQPALDVTDQQTGHRVAVKSETLSDNVQKYSNTSSRQVNTDEELLHISEIPFLPRVEYDFLTNVGNIDPELFPGVDFNERIADSVTAVEMTKLSSDEFVAGFDGRGDVIGSRDIASAGFTSSGQAMIDIPGAPQAIAEFNAVKPVNVTCDYDYNSMSDISSAEDIEKLHYYLSLDRFKQEVAWSPDGKYLAFSDNNRIWLVPVEGGEPVLVYEYKQNGFSVGAICDLSFSPDGNEIVFTKNVYDPERGSIIKITYQTNKEPFGNFTNPIPNIESVNLSTGSHRILIEEAYNGIWSRDGSILFYHHFDSKIYTGDPDEINMRPMLFDIITGEKIVLATEDFFYGRGTFSPDDSYLVIPIREYGQPTQLYRLNLSGGDKIPLTTYNSTSATGRNIRTPAFDPSGRWILYTDASWRPDAPDQSLWVYSTVTGGQYPLFEGCEFEQFGAAWDPEGQRYSFIMKQEGVNQLYIMEFNTPEQEKEIVRDIDKPLVFELKPNYPNPFNIETTIEFSTSEPGDVTFRIYSITGQTIRTLVDSSLEPGRHRIVWDGRDDYGNDVASGTYLSRLALSGGVRQGKMTLLK